MSFIDHIYAAGRIPFNAAACHLGCLGVISKVALQVPSTLSLAFYANPQSNPAQQKDTTGWVPLKVYQLLALPKDNDDERQDDRKEESAKIHKGNEDDAAT